ncbi:hypothetical protein NQ314_014425 [Rhamnusium bicolor]|uniref:Uncharacterized protein n=1 Tax=Rhamnusium bicolor TaxID=1586634 RepID=A0AAV8X1X4_9CUCU|nr:hypothetical protein NQ314_014425 [Rhamnusium bicolor]
MLKFPNIFNKYPNDCKKLTKQNVGDCMKKACNILRENSAEIQTALMGAISTVFEGSQKCKDNVMNAIKHSDEYIKNGCPDES